jgi:hypothetical protein
MMKNSSGGFRKMGKYAKNCVTMFLRLDNPPRPGRPGTFFFGQEHKGQDYFKDTPNLVEIMPITGNYMMMNGLPRGFENKIYTMPDGHKGGPYPKIHRKADKLVFFVGTDPNNINDLGAHVEFHMGEGKDQEVFEFDEPRCVFVPKGVRHGPIYITKFHRNLIITQVYSVPSREACDTINDFDYIGDDKKIQEVIGSDISKYKEFYSENPK